MNVFSKQKNPVGAFRPLPPGPFLPSSSAMPCYLVSYLVIRRNQVQLVDHAYGSNSNFFTINLSSGIALYSRISGTSLCGIAHCSARSLPYSVHRWKSAH